MLTVKQIREGLKLAKEQGDECDLVVACGPLTLYVSNIEDGWVSIDTTLRIVQLENGDEDWEYSSEPMAEAMSEMGLMLDGEVTPIEFVATAIVKKRHSVG